MAAFDDEFHGEKQSEAKKQDRPPKKPRSKKAPVEAIESVKSLRERFKHHAGEDPDWARMRPLD